MVVLSKRVVFWDGWVLFGGWRGTSDGEAVGRVIC